ncbi:uncharacterized protein DDB_G0281497-like [Trichogramma pretiosum]|uniref:uncharacterized protein DDB_G0281497-like n=1 Tax=Trichogramma pretiosum TaxID=7493 RepID=UPI0006C9CE15|nr:uncharacterized protein DDB_G0281497-like [Trichogramma pretiosum]
MAPPPLQRFQASLDYSLLGSVGLDTQPAFGLDPNGNFVGSEGTRANITAILDGHHWNVTIALTENGTNTNYTNRIHINELPTDFRQTLMNLRFSLQPIGSNNDTNNNISDSSSDSSSSDSSSNSSSSRFSSSSSFSSNSSSTSDTSSFSGNSSSGIFSRMSNIDSFFSRRSSSSSNSSNSSNSSSSSSSGSSVSSIDQVGPLLAHALYMRQLGNKKKRCNHGEGSFCSKCHIRKRHTSRWWYRHGSKK